MDKNKKTYLLKIWVSIVLLFTLFPINYLLHDYGIDLFSNKILVPIIFVYLFAIAYLYHIKFSRKDIKEKTIKNLNKLRVSLRTAKSVAIVMAIFAWFFSVFILLVVLYAFFSPFELYDSPEINNLIYFGIMMIFCAVIALFFQGLFFYEQSKVYSFLSSEKIN